MLYTYDTKALYHILIKVRELDGLQFSKFKRAWLMVSNRTATYGSTLMNSGSKSAEALLNGMRLIPIRMSHKMNGTSLFVVKGE